jgi:hypothetical protein
MAVARDGAFYIANTIARRKYTNDGLDYKGVLTRGRLSLRAAQDVWIKIRRSLRFSALRKTLSARGTRQIDTDFHSRTVRRRTVSVMAKDILCLRVPRFPFSIGMSYLPYEEREPVE